MKKTKRLLLILIFVFLIFNINTKAKADSIEDKLNLEELYSAVDSETADYLSMANITGSTVLEPEYGKIIETIEFIFGSTLPSVTENFILLSVICILSSLISTFDTENNVSDFAFVSAAAFIIYPVIIRVSGAVNAACGSLSVFIKSSIPVYGGIITFSGKALSAASYTSLTLFAAEAADFIVTVIALPLIPIMLALCLASAVSGRSFNKINENIQKTVKWTLVLTVTVFSAVTSLQTVISSSTDALTMKSARLAVSTAVPIVGSALGDALSAVQGGLAVIKSGAGAFGILAVIFIFAPVVIKCSLNMFSLFALNIICELFNINKLNSLINGCISVYKLMLACSFTMVSVSIISGAILITLIKA